MQLYYLVAIPDLLNVTTPTAVTTARKWEDLTVTTVTIVIRGIFQLVTGDDLVFVTVTRTVTTVTRAFTVTRTVTG